MMQVSEMQAQVIASQKGQSAANGENQSKDKGQGKQGQDKQQGQQGQGQAQQLKDAKSANMPICDFYTTALFTSNTAENQRLLLVKLVNTVIIGSYTPGKTAQGLVGILAPGSFNGIPVTLLPFFDGTLKTTNVGGVASNINFLDDGGAEPLKKDKPANGSTSRQFNLLTHLYSFFGTALGCSKIGNGFDAYTGKQSMTQVHAFMNLDRNQLGFFTQQLGLAAQSFGVAAADVATVAGLMNSVFNVQCGKPSTPFAPLQGGQSFCLAKDCPLAKEVDSKCVDSLKMGTVVLGLQGENDIVLAGTGQSQGTMAVGQENATGQGMAGQGFGQGMNGEGQNQGLSQVIKCHPK
jgi:hypothetical protein